MLAPKKANVKKHMKPGHEGVKAAGFMSTLPVLFAFSRKLIVLRLSRRH